LFRGVVLDRIPADIEEGATKQMRLQPLSSFSSNLKNALSFGDVLIGTRVPAERVFSCPRTGFGCLPESEFVLLGDDTKAFAYHPKLPIGTPGKIEMKVQIDDFVGAMRRHGITKSGDSDRQIFPDRDLVNADWTKRSWDLTGIRSRHDLKRFLGEIGMTIDQFKELPVCRSSDRRIES